MKNSADLGGFYPSRPSASVDNTLLDLQNSSYPTQPHSIIAKNYIYHVFSNWCTCLSMFHALHKEDTRIKLEEE